MRRSTPTLRPHQYCSVSAGIVTTERRRVTPYVQLIFGTSKLKPSRQTRTCAAFGDGWPSCIFIRSVLWTHFLSYHHPGTMLYTTDPVPVLLATEGSPQNGGRVRSLLTKSGRNEKGIGKFGRLFLGRIFKNSYRPSIRVPPIARESYLICVPYFQEAM